jgi:hypothetical protein
MSANISAIATLTGRALTSFACPFGVVSIRCADFDD